MAKMVSFKEPRFEAEEILKWKRVTVNFRWKEFLLFFELSLREMAIARNEMKRFRDKVSHFTFDFAEFRFCKGKIILISCFGSRIEIPVSPDSNTVLFSSSSIPATNLTMALFFGILMRLCFAKFVPSKITRNALFNFAAEAEAERERKEWNHR